MVTSLATLLESITGKRLWRCLLVQGLNRTWSKCDWAVRESHNRCVYSAVQICCEVLMHAHQSFKTLRISLWSTMSWMAPNALLLGVLCRPQGCYMAGTLHVCNTLQTFLLTTLCQRPFIHAKLCLTDLRLTSLTKSGVRACGLDDVYFWHVWPGTQVVDRFLCTISVHVAGTLVNTPRVACHCCSWLVRMQSFRSPWGHGLVALDRRHCKQWTSSLFLLIFAYPFIKYLFLWHTSQEFVKPDLYPLSRGLSSLSGMPSVRPGAGW